MKHIEIKYVNIEDLQPYENNPRNNENAVEIVANSIDEFGFKVPIVIDSENTIVCGHTRYLAAEMLGIEKVPCIVADDLSEEQIKAFRLVDNKTAEIATWNSEKYELEMKDLSLDMELFGFETLDEYASIDDEEVHTELNKAHYLKIDNTKIELTEEEYTALKQVIDNYAEENGVTFGFVRWLLNDKVC